MKIRKKIGRRVLTLALSVFMLCGMTAFPRTARADDGTRPGSIDQPLISDDAYVNLWTSDAGFSTDGGRRDYKLAVQVYVDNSLMTTYSRYHGYDKAGRTVSAWAEGKNRYTLTGLKLTGDAVQNPLALVPQDRCDGHAAARAGRHHAEQLPACGWGKHRRFSDDLERP